MDKTERQFRFELREQALACAWDDWHATRLIFADWLQEHGRPEELLARATWGLASKPIQLHHQKHPWCYRFLLDVPGWRRQRLEGWLRAHNEDWLLGFGPWTLKVQGLDAGPPSLRLTWVPTRHRGKWKKGDREVDGAFGLVGLFARRDEPGLFDNGGVHAR